MPSAPEPAPVPLEDESAIAARTPSRVHNAADAEEKRGLNDSGEPTSEDSSNAPPEEFKEGGYGWVVVLAVFLLNAHTWGMNSSYAVFLAYYLQNGKFPGASDIAFAFVGGLSISIALLISPLATACVGRYGTRPTLIVGIFFETIAFIGASFTSQMWHLLLSQGVAFGIGMGFIFVASVGIVPQWFTKRRSFANSIGTAGSGFGGLTYSLATNAMIRNIGLAWAFRVLAILACAVNLVSTLLVRDRNKSVGAVHVAFHAALFRKAEYWLLIAWSFFSLLAYVIVVFSLPSYAAAVGGTAAQGSLVGALFNLSQGLGRPLIGLASDPVGRLNVSALGTLAAGLAALFLWIFAGKFYGGLVVYSLLGGFAGIMWATVAPVAAEIVGIPLLPSALSILWVILAFPATFAEVIGLSLRTDAGTDSYLHAQLFAGFCYIAAFIAGWLLRAWKLHQLDDMHLTQAQEAAEIRDATAFEQIESQRTSFASYLLKGRWIYAVTRV